MKRKMLPVILGLGLMSSSLALANQSTVNCGSPTWTSKEIGGNLYNFVSEAKCTITGSISNYKDLLEAYNDALKKRAATKEVINASTYSEKVDLTLKEFYHTEHGDMTFETDNLLTAELSSFTFDSKATKFIKLTKQTDATKAIALNVTVKKLSSNEIEVVVKKDINVKKPFGVPEFLFISPSKECLQKDVEELSIFHAGIVSSIL